MSKNEANHSESRREDWGTPRDLFARLSVHFDFVIDLCANEENALCENYISPEIDIFEDWSHEIVAGACEHVRGYPCAWMNPPYMRGGKTGEFVQRAVTLCNAQDIDLMCLVPASVGSRWWHDHVYPNFQFYAFPRRLTYDGAPTTAQFDSAIIFRPIDCSSRRADEIANVMSAVAGQCYRADRSGNLL